MRNQHLLLRFNFVHKTAAMFGGVVPLDSLADDDGLPAEANINKLAEGSWRG